MNTSKISKRLGFLVFCLAFTLTMCGAAAAAPTNTTHVTLNQSVNHTTNQVNTTTKTKLPDPQIYRNGKSVGTYSTIASALLASKSGDTIMLANDATFNENTLTISHSLTFNVIGLTHNPTINAQGKGPIFIIENGANLILNNINLENGKSAYGGAINIKDGTLTVNNCAFNFNTATYGGAIYNPKGETLTIISSAFST